MNMQQRFTTQRVLSPALYGEILLCHDNATNEQVVIKKIDQGASASRKTVQRQRVVLEDTRFEQFVNKTLHEEGGHPNVLTMQTMFAADGYDHFVFEYCNRGALFDVMEDATDKQLDPYYIAPEVFDNVAPYDPSKADVWSLGIILFLLLTGVPLVNLPSKMDESYMFLSRFGLKKLIQGWELEDFVSDDAANLLEKMLCINPNQRCTLQEVAQHPYVLRRT
ncbi:hypothetical protein AaE_003776 [Aphanomyces astaci]|uniref:Protein kinase domain-containing protein n=1 Tax=Aphanomyces astaci TaxID=112090 RepID=A0A6A5AK38_APHAT|nr:hypothetical protein AaE_003776 [Aphanomyces astaci]